MTSMTTKRELTHENYQIEHIENLEGKVYRQMSTQTDKKVWLVPNFDVTNVKGVRF